MQYTLVQLMMKTSNEVLEGNQEGMRLYELVQAMRQNQNHHLAASNSDNTKYTAEQRT